MHLISIVFAGFALSGVAFAVTPGDSIGGQIVVAQADVRPLVSGERARVKKLSRDLESVMQTLNEGGVEPFQDPAYVQKFRDALDRYRTALARYPQVEDPDVQGAAAKLAELENMIAYAINEASKQVDDLGDVQAILAGIERDLRAHRAPQWLPAPFDDEEARNWVTAAANAKLISQRAIEQLQHIGQVAHLPINPGTVQQGAPYDKQDIDRLLRFAQGTVREVDEAVQQTLANLKAAFEMQHGELDYYRNLDPGNDSDRMNAFLREGAQEEIYGGLDRHLAFAQSVAAYQRAFGSEPGDATRSRIQEIGVLRDRYAANRIKALGDSRLPEPQSLDDARLAIAERILAEPRYEFGPHGPVVLTTRDVVEREEQVSRAQIKDVDFSLSGQITLSGTETTWNYRWQEFKFATPIREDDGDDWYVWWITAKKFSSGWEGTPIGEWVSGAATKGDLILERNFTR